MPYCWLICLEGSICRVDKTLDMTQCFWASEDVCGIHIDADLAQVRQQGFALCVVLRANQKKMCNGFWCVTDIT